MEKAKRSESGESSQSVHLSIGPARTNRGDKTSPNIQHAWTDVPSQGHHKHDFMGEQGGFTPPAGKTRWKNSTYSSQVHSFNLNEEPELEEATEEREETPQLLTLTLGTGPFVAEPGVADQGELHMEITGMHILSPLVGEMEARELAPVENINEHMGNGPLTSTNRKCITRAGGQKEGKGRDAMTRPPFITPTRSAVQLHRKEAEKLLLTKRRGKKHKGNGQGCN